jgi:hypothetical protein
MPVLKRVQSVRRTLAVLAAITVALAAVLAPSESPGVVMLPCMILSLTVISLWIWSRKPSMPSSMLLLVLLVLDLGHLGYFIIRPAVLADSMNPMKTGDLHSLERVAAGSQQRITPLRAADESLNIGPPNLSRLWEIPSAGGYNPLVLRRYTEFAGIAPEGRISYTSLDSANRSLDLLALRFLLVPNQLFTGRWQFERFGLGWRHDDLDVQLGSGCGSANPQSVVFNLPDVETTTVGIASSMSCSLPVENQSDVLKVTATAADGAVRTLFLKAGTHTSEWAWDRSDVRSAVGHARATIFDSFPSVDDHGSGFQGHHYVAMLSVPPMAIHNLRLEWVGTAGMMSLQKITLRDDASKRSYAVTREGDYLLDENRWHPLQSFGETKVFENTRAMARVWLVPKVTMLSAPAVLHAIHTSRLPNGMMFAPGEMALTETPLNLDSPVDPERTATIQSAAETGIQIRTHSSQTNLLVLSNVYYAGWQATVDGIPSSVLPTDYVLRGVVVPAGDHVVTFRFRPVSLQIGFALSALSALGLVMLCVPRRGAG